MPKPLDLLGQRFGQLVVIAAAGKIKYGSMMPAWLCRCDCGNEEIVPQRRLPYAAYLINGKDSSRALVTACETCRLTRTCVICGARFFSRQAAATCSADCMTEHRRQIQLAYYYRATAADPQLNRKRHAAARDRAAADPAIAARQREVSQAASRRRVERERTDPDYRAARRAQSRAHYAKHAAEIQARRRERLARLDPAALARWIERARRYGRAYRRRWYAELKASPERHQQYLAIMREYDRQRELARLMAISHELDQRIDK